MISTCAHTKTRSRTFVTSPSPNRSESAFDTGDQLAGHSFSPSAIRDRVPEQQRRDDAGDQREDQVGLAEVAALEARRPLDLADQSRPDHAGEHEHGEDVDQQREPALVAEPGQRGVAVDRADHRDQDRREEDEEAPEDRGVDQARDEPLEQLALAQHDLGLVAGALRQVAGAVGRLAHPHEARRAAAPAA